MIKGRKFSMSSKKNTVLRDFIDYILSKWEFIFFSFGFIAYLLYVFYAYVEAPFESFIDKFYLIKLAYSGKLRFKDLLIPYTENGMLASNLFFLFNLKLFKFSVLAESLMNALLVAIIGYMVIFKYTKLLNVRKNAFYYVSVVVMAAFLFTFMQQGGGGMSLQVRFGLTAFVVVSFMIDKVFLNKCGILYYFFTIVMIFMSINVFGSAYSFAELPFIFLIILVLIISRKKLDWKNIGIGFAYVCAGVLYFVEYGFLEGAGQSDNAVGGGLFVKLWYFLSNIKNVITGFVFWCGSVVLGRSSIEEGWISPNMYLLVGVIVLVMIIIAIYLYFKSRMYEVTYLPIMWFGYFVILYFIICAGRIEVLEVQGVAWVTSSWYTVHTKLIPAVILGVYLYAIDCKKVKFTFTKICIYISGLFLFLTLAYGSFCNFIRLPSERLWVKNRQAYFFAESIDELPVDENGMTPLMQDQKTSWEAIKTLRKYHLSLFRDYDAYQIMESYRESVQNQ